MSRPTSREREAESVPLQWCCSGTEPHLNPAHGSLGYPPEHFVLNDNDVVRRVPGGQRVGYQSDDLHPERNVSQPGLRVGANLTIQQRFEEWLETTDGQEVYWLLVKRARRLLRNGWKHYSHKAIIETIRYDRDVKVGPENGYKINDHYSSRLARRAMAQYSYLDGFFEVRTLKA